MDSTSFQEIVWDYYAQHGRDLPWRLEPFDPYHILVSEMMLQQTQVSRVIPKYQAFISQFPTALALVKAPLAEVLVAWQGLGYNRRAKYLHDAVKQLFGQGKWSYDTLVACKGIGPNTAKAILTYSYGQPHVFIETNIRTVYIHHFFKDKNDVRDTDILELIAKTLPRVQEEQPERRIHSAPRAMRNPSGVFHYREWYWALMDYGSHLKQTVGNIARQSKHYKKQSTFHGSARQLRGHIIRLLSVEAKQFDELQRESGNDPRLETQLRALISEGLITYQGQHYRLAK